MNFITRLRESLIVVLLIVILSPLLLSAQMHTNLTEPARVGSNPPATQLDPAKRIGRHTVAEWRSLIDSTWGEGLPTADKLKIFDDFWTAVDQRWGGFPNLTVNWDSLKDVYRPEVAAGVSRGRFDAILCRLNRALNEGHVWIYDEGIDGSMGYFFSRGTQYPNYQSFHYVQGLPVMMINALTFRTNFGAGLTPLPDSTALVYSVMPDHPLDLQPGDIILGYDGVPWMTLFNELLDVEFPILGGGSWLGSTPEASLYSAIISAGMNWGLFDTIDVKKYPTNEVVHYPTSLIGSIQRPYFVATQQVPVSGIPFPDIQNGKMVSWGIITGTNIGYIYTWDWGGPVGNQTDELFSQAVDTLLHVHKVDGLIIDSRTNFGGAPNNANGGFRQLFNFDPLSNYSIAKRVAGDNHLAFSFEPFHGVLMGPFTATREIFDHPIAVLTNSTSTSGGDYNANRMRFHPMVRFFGRPTNGAYTAVADYSEWERGTRQSTYMYSVPHGSVYSNYNNEGYLIHNPFPVDEDVWLTRDGVANGEDDVVKKALEWISTLSYAHDVIVDRDTVNDAADSIWISASVRNPSGHRLAISAYVADSNEAVVDTVFHYPLQGDTTWETMFKPPHAKGTYSVSICTYDSMSAGFRTIPDVVSFVVIGADYVASSLPWRFALHQNYPNPFNPSTTINYELSAVSHVTLTVYDVLGREVATLVNEKKSPGTYEVKFDASGLSSGVYFYKIKAGTYTSVKKMLMLK